MIDEVTSYPEMQRRDRVEKSLKKRWDALLCDVAEELKTRGVERPEIYIEGEAGLYAIDGGHPHWDGEDIKRQQAVVFGPLGWPGKFVCDVGAW